MEVVFRCALPGLPVDPASLGDLVTSRGSIGSGKRRLGESDCRSVLRYGGGEREEVPVGDEGLPTDELGDKPGNILGSRVELTGQVWVSACLGSVEDMSGTDEATISSCSAAAFGSCEASPASRLIFDISVSFDRFLW